MKDLRWIGEKGGSERRIWKGWATRSSWLNCALRDDEAVHWVSIGYCEALAIGNWLYWVSRGHLCLYILHKVEIWTGVTDAWLTDWQTTLKDRATQLLIKYKSGALVTQYSATQLVSSIKFKTGALATQFWKIFVLSKKKESHNNIWQSGK